MTLRCPASATDVIRSQKDLHKMNALTRCLVRCFSAKQMHIHFESHSRIGSFQASHDTMIVMRIDTFHSLLTSNAPPKKRRQTDTLLSIQTFRHTERCHQETEMTIPLDTDLRLLRCLVTCPQKFVYKHSNVHTFGQITVPFLCNIARANSSLVSCLAEIHIRN